LSVERAEQKRALLWFGYREAQNIYGARKQTKMAVTLTSAESTNNIAEFSVERFQFLVAIIVKPEPKRLLCIEPVKISLAGKNRKIFHLNCYVSFQLNDLIVVLLLMSEQFRK
jgi:hypothetical protein